MGLQKLKQKSINLIFNRFRCLLLDSNVCVIIPYEIYLFIVAVFLSGLLRKYFGKICRESLNKSDVNSGWMYGWIQPHQGWPRGYGSLVEIRFVEMRRR